MLGVILGGARSVWEDLDNLCALRKPDVIIATNDAGAYYSGPVHHWVTLHYEKLPRWKADRAARELPPAECYWVHEGATIPRSAPFDSQTRTVADLGGSSGLFGVKVGATLGLRKIVLAGVPMEPEDGHFFDHKRWEFATRYRQAWTRHHQEFAPIVRSMSGWTAALFGKPDEVWLQTKE